MANTHSQIFYHLVFAVKNRESLITEAFKEDLYKYMTGIIKKQNQKLYIINGTPDHVHVLINCKPNVNLSELVKEIKEHSSKFINAKNILPGKFYWQSGFGVTSVSHKNVQSVFNYIRSQEALHARKSFNEEYIGFLDENKIVYKPEELFDFELK